MTDRRDELARFATAVSDAVAGRRRLPVVTARQAVAITGALQAEIDHAAQVRDAAVEEAGHRVACAPGCNACCHLIVVPMEGEVVAIAEWLERPENAAAREKFFDAFEGWRRRLGPALDELTRVLDRAPPAEVEAALDAGFRRGALCAFNHDGLCTIYPVRPALCRAAHALDTPMHCGPAGDGQIDYYSFEPLEQLMQEMRRLGTVLHHALRGAAPREPLCLAVYRRLTARMTGRNEACPCGSGKKYKRCCGA